MAVHAVNNPNPKVNPRAIEAIFWSLCVTLCSTKLSGSNVIIVGVLETLHELKATRSFDRVEVITRL